MALSVVCPNFFELKIYKKLANAGYLPDLAWPESHTCLCQSAQLPLVPASLKTVNPTASLFCATLSVFMMSECGINDGSTQVVLPFGAFPCFSCIDLGLTQIKVKTEDLSLRSALYPFLLLHQLPPDKTSQCMLNEPWTCLMLDSLLCSPLKIWGLREQSLGMNIDIWKPRWHHAPSFHALHPVHRQGNTIESRKTQNMNCKCGVMLGTCSCQLSRYFYAPCALYCNAYLSGKKPFSTSVSNNPRGVPLGRYWQQPNLENGWDVPTSVCKNVDLYSLASWFFPLPPVVVLKFPTVWKVSCISRI